uniref:N-acyl-aromatic-L-amino acid amidohydrolase n=1 Tax=Salarias fasciatus TaxID=181472 RepID=A0A672H415_SALFA
CLNCHIILVIFTTKLSRVAVCGGTHGNELSGVYLVRELLRTGGGAAAAAGEGGPEVLTVMSNPRAVQQCRRYVETDLNRCFTHAILNGPPSENAPYEITRSRELNALLGPKGSPEAADLVCDLHNTTANMGLCLIAYSDCDWICLQIFRHLQASARRPSHVKSFHPISVLAAMEIGPQPHGVVRSNVFTAMKLGVRHTLDWVGMFNSGKDSCVEVYTMVRNIDYPRDKETHSITAAIHPQLQDRDFCLLRPGDPLFQTFSGETLRYKGGEPLYPFFINECAYYEKGIAVSLARKTHVMVPAIRCFHIFTLSKK